MIGGMHFSIQTVSNLGKNATCHNLAKAEN